MSLPSSFPRAVLGAAALAVLAGGALALVPNAIQTAAAAPPPVKPPIHVPLPISAGYVPPTLTGIEGSTQLKPGATVTVDGSNFGSEQGFLCMRWSQVLVQNLFTQNGQLCLGIVSWSDTRVTARVSPDITGVADQPATLRLSQGGANGVTSSPLSVGFVAARETVRLTDQPANLSISCSQEAGSINDCSATQATHINHWYNSGSDGTDTYALTLANGWTFDSVTMTQEDVCLADICVGGNWRGGASLASDPPAKGAVSGTVAVHWTADAAAGRVRYDLTINLNGPKGVPFE